MKLVIVSIDREPTEVQRATTNLLLLEAVHRICDAGPVELRETARNNGTLIVSAALAGLPVPEMVASMVSKALRAVGCEPKVEAA